MTGGCDSATTECSCDAGWSGLGCEIADCAGTPDCNGHGYCNASLATPACECSYSWMGHACDLQCLHGNKQPADSDNCVCDVGWTTIECNVECSMHGHVDNNMCICNSGWRGNLCDIPGCPGEFVSEPKTKRDPESLQQDTELIYLISPNGLCDEVCETCLLRNRGCATAVSHQTN